MHTKRLGTNSINITYNINFTLPYRITSMKIVPYLMYGGQVTVGICKRWVDLYSPCIALQSPLNILHFFQGITHVGVGISKSWRNPGKRKIYIQILLHNSRTGITRC